MHFTLALLSFTVQCNESGYQSCLHWRSFHITATITEYETAFLYGHDVTRMIMHKWIHHPLSLFMFLIYIALPAIYEAFTFSDLTPTLTYTFVAILLFSLHFFTCTFVSLKYSFITFSFTGFGLTASCQRKEYYPQSVNKLYTLHHWINWNALHGNHGQTNRGKEIVVSYFRRQGPRPWFRWFDILHGNRRSDYFRISDIKNFESTFNIVSTTCTWIECVTMYSTAHTSFPFHRLLSSISPHHRYASGL